MRLCFLRIAVTIRLVTVCIVAGIVTYIGLATIAQCVVFGRVASAIVCNLARVVLVRVVLVRVVILARVVLV